MGFVACRYVSFEEVVSLFKEMCFRTYGEYKDYCRVNKGYPISLKRVYGVPFSYFVREQGGVAGAYMDRVERRVKAYEDRCRHLCEMFGKEWVPVEYRVRYMGVFKGKIGPISDDKRVVNGWLLGQGLLCQKK